MTTTTTIVLSCPPLPHMQLCRRVPLQLRNFFIVPTSPIVFFPSQRHVVKCRTTGLRHHVRALRPLERSGIILPHSAVTSQMKSGNGSETLLTLMFRSIHKLWKFRAPFSFLLARALGSLLSSFLVLRPMVHFLWTHQDRRACGRHE